MGSDRKIDQRRKRFETLSGIELDRVYERSEGLEGDYQKLWASPYDAHPGALAHDLIAASLEQRMLSLWPDLGH